MTQPTNPNMPNLANPAASANPAAPENQAPSLAQLRQAADLMRQKQNQTEALAAAVGPQAAAALSVPKMSNTPVRTVPAEKPHEPTVAKPDAQEAKAQASSPAMDELRRQAMARAKGNRADSRLALGIGTELQEYTIEWVLGVGGFGITYLALDGNLETEVAIKEYIPSEMVMRNSDGSLSPKDESSQKAFKEGLDKFLMECRTLANFKHSNVVRVTRFFQANGTAYMVMEYEHGKTFREWMEEKGGADEAQLLKMFVPMLEGLEVVHQAGFLHRDIKPANIFVRDNESMVLLDFGAARHAIGNVSRSLTTIVTPGYAPFEQYHSHGKQGPWTDLYALAGVMYWVVSGGTKPAEAPSRIKQDNMPKAVKLGEGRFSEGFLAALDWALMPNETARPQSVAAFKVALTAPAPPAGAPPAAPSGVSATAMAKTQPQTILNAGAASPASQATPQVAQPAPQAAPSSQPNARPGGSPAVPPVQGPRTLPQAVKPPADMTVTQTERWWKFWK